MKTILENDDFCRDAFELANDFRDAAVAQMARAGKQARVVRRVQAVSAVVLIALVGGTLMMRKPDAPRIASVTREKPAMTWVVQTKPFAGVIQSKSLPENILARSSGENVVIVRSSGPRDLEISDEQLLQFAGGRSVGLLKIDGAMELTFLGP